MSVCYREWQDHEEWIDHEQQRHLDHFDLAGRPDGTK